MAKVSQVKRYGKIIVKISESTLLCFLGKCFVSFLESTSYQTNARKLGKAAIKRRQTFPHIYEAEALAGRVVCFLVIPSFGGWLLRDIRKELSLLLKMRLRHGHASAFLLSPLWWTGVKNTNVRVKIQTERATTSLPLCLAL